MGSPRLRIGLDYVPAATHWPGVGRWARELVRALVQLDDAPDLSLWQVAGRPQRLPEASLGLAGSPLAARGGLARLRRRVPRRVLSCAHRWTGVGADRLLGGVSLFQRFLPAEPPLARHTPRVLGVSELPPPGSTADRRLADDLASGAHALVTSRHGAAEIERLFELPPERIHRVPVGCDHWARDLRGREPIEPVAGPPVVLCLGAVRPERRQVALLRAIEELLRGGLEVRLLLVGHRTGASAELERALASSPVAAAVDWITAPVEADLPRIVAGAGVLVHLAENELTAVTPLEAASLGTAVVASRLPAFAEHLAPPECVDPAVAVLIDNGTLDEDRRALAEAIASALGRAEDPEAIDARRALARRFSWRRHAIETAAAWRAILGAGV